METSIPTHQLRCTNCDRVIGREQLGGDLRCSDCGHLFEVEYPRWPAGAGAATPSAFLSARPRCVGYERNTHGKLAPRMIDLSALMSPLLLASASVDLNLRLMRWRQLPALDLPVLASTRCLLLGAGAGRRASIRSAMSSIDHSLSVTPAAMAGVMRSVLWMRTKL